MRRLKVVILAITTVVFGACSKSERPSLPTEPVYWYGSMEIKARDEQARPVEGVPIEVRRAWGDGAVVLTLKTSPSGAAMISGGLLEGSYSVRATAPPGWRMGFLEGGSVETRVTFIGRSQHGMTVHLSRGTHGVSEE